jgi:hypothetical protein
MQIAINIDAKKVLAMLAVAVVSGGSFFAGMHYQAIRQATRANDEPEAVVSRQMAQDHPDDPYASIAFYPLPDSAANDGEVSWCAAHPSTKWEFGPLTAEGRKAMRANGLTDDKPLAGFCDASGSVHVNPRR